MSKFIIFFEEKEGTSALLRLLDNFKDVSIVHLVPGDERAPDGWEPFDKHQGGRMSLRVLKRCLNLVLSESAIDFERLNKIYTKKAIRPLEPIDPRVAAIGFKMRYHPPSRPRYASMFRRVSPRIFRALVRRHYRAFERMIIDVLQRNDVVVFIAVRQDVFRWGLSKYHGDGTGKKGHLQFKLASGEIDKGDIGKISVDTDRLERIIAKCEEAHTLKRRLLEKLAAAGIRAYPLLYEDFLENKPRFFAETLAHLGMQVSPEEIESALGQGAVFKKVHSDDISSFVENHEEVKRKFADRFVSWR